MGYGRYIAAVALAVLAAAGPVAAQQLLPPPVSVPGGREVSVDLIANLIYNSNVAASNEASAAARGLTQADEIFNPAVNFTLARNIGSQLAFLQGGAGYNFYDHNSVLDRANLDISGGLNGRLGPCDDTLTGSYVLQQSDLDYTQTNTVKNLVQLPTVGLTATCGRPIGFAPTASVSGSWRINSSETLKPSDSGTFNATAGLAYRQPALGVITAFGEYGETNFQNSQIYFNGSILTSGYNIYGGGISYSRNIGARLDLTASLSYISLVENIPGTQGFNGITYSFDGTYKVGPRLTAHARFARATLPSNQTNGTFSLSEVYEADASYLASSRLTFDLLGSITHQTFEGVPLNNALALTEQTIDKINASATFKASQHLSLTLNGGWQQRDANEPGFSYSAAIVSLAVSAPF